MPVLPASVRVALWASAAFNGKVALADVASKALPDMDDINGLSPILSSWSALGERCVFVALPRPGRLAGMPGAAPATMAAAAQAQEVIYVPSLGGALIPTIGPYGSATDQGWQITWSDYPSDPVPQHVVEALSVVDVELRLRSLLAEAIADLEITPGAPMAGAASEVFARRRLSDRWGMPPGMPHRPSRIIELAGSILTLTDIGLSEPLQSVHSSATQHRERALRRLQDEALDAMADASNVAVAHYAGWR